MVGMTIGSKKRRDVIPKLYNKFKLHLRASFMNGPSVDSPLCEAEIGQYSKRVETYTDSVYELLAEKEHASCVGCLKKYIETLHNLVKENNRANFDCKNTPE